MDRKEVIEKFEEDYKDIFRKTLDLVTYYTGFHLRVNFGKFEYVDTPIRKDWLELGIETKIEYNDELTIITKVLAPCEKIADHILYGHAIAAAHEAGDVAYLATRRRISRYHYRIDAETMGEFFFRLFCKKYGMKLGSPHEYFGVYELASKRVDDLEELPLKDQIATIRKSIFKKDRKWKVLLMKLLDISDRQDRNL